MTTPDPLAQAVERLEDTHRDAQFHESLAVKLRKIANYLTHSLRCEADPGQLNSQLTTLALAAETLEWLARQERVEARCATLSQLSAQSAQEAGEG